MEKNLTYKIENLPAAFAIGRFLRMCGFKAGLSGYLKFYYDSYPPRRAFLTGVLPEKVFAKAWGKTKNLLQ